MEQAKKVTSMARIFRQSRENILKKAIFRRIIVCLSITQESGEKSYIII